MVDDIFCAEESITFTATGATTYTFLINGVVVQDPSPNQTFDTILSASSTVTVIGDTVSQVATIRINLYEEGNTYSIEVLDANGCDKEIIVDVKVQEIDCKNGILGKISLDLISGTIPVPEDVQIQWISADSNLYHTWATYEGKLENITRGGKYNVIVSQKNCILFEAYNIEIPEIDSTQLAVSVVSESSGSCGDLGRIELSLSGGVTPYQIYWELFTTVVSSTLISQTSGATPTLVSNDIVKWIRVARLNNNAIATDLEPGVYRAIIMDDSNEAINSNCGGTWVSRNFNIGNERFEVINFKSQIDTGSCDSGDTTGSIRFEVLNTIPNPYNNVINIKINLDGTDITSSINKIGNIYNYEGILTGDHTLLVEPLSGVTTSTSFCSALQAFTIDMLTPILFEGDTQYELDICEEFIELAIDPSSITGGVPFIIEGQATYDFEWQYTPDENIDKGPQTYVGDTVFEAFPGTYKVKISDQRYECPGIEQTIIVLGKDNGGPFIVQGVLNDNISNLDSSSTSGLVKALAPNCQSVSDNGRIGIEISGGIKPYLIKWFKEEIITDTDSISLVEISSAINSTQLYNLSPGKYKLVIKSEGTNGCTNESGLNQNNYHEEYIFVPKNEELYIIEGPYVDNDLCKGLPGRLSVEIYDNLQDGLSFYYNNAIVSLAEDQPVKEGSYILLIDKPVPEASLLITNREGCTVSAEVVITEVGTPDFEYSSPSLEANGTILAREEIKFTNTSKLPYAFSEWNFGDGTDKEIVYSNRTASPTLHAYGISGVYFITLRNFNEAGCYEEINKQIKIGKGYNIITPNVFSPNNDGINDFFRSLFSGFGKVSFRVYDDRGNILYEEHIEEDNPTQISGIKLQGWSGDNATGLPYYIYQFTGYLITDQTKIERSGTFVLIR